jgi:pimeloyl-ACP methyl ester carboxylesterase/uncharacterized protein (UPF0335 family)
MNKKRILRAVVLLFSALVVVITGCDGTVSPSDKTGDTPISENISLELANQLESAQIMISDLQIENAGLREEITDLLSKQSIAEAGLNAQLEQALATITELEKENAELQQQVSDKQTPADIPASGSDTSNVFTITITPKKGITRVEADPDKGFYCDYFLYVPANVAKTSLKKYILVESNNTGIADLYTTHQLGTLDVIERSRASLADSLLVPLLMPVFPRNMSIRSYTHALDRASFTASDVRYKRLDLQLIAMIDDARERLQEQGIEVGEKVIMNGFSASGMFASRFTLLHPDRVHAAAIGSPGGWPAAPVASYEGTTLNYPVGIADIEQLTGEKFDLESFLQVEIYLYLGDQDTNCSIHGTTAGPLGWTQADRDLIARLFGTTPNQRWPKAVELFKSVEAKAQYVLFPGVGHSMMIDEIETFLRSKIR